jgi:hypothetical protein
MQRVIKNSYPGLQGRCLQGIGSASLGLANFDAYVRKKTRLAPLTRE